MSVERSTTSVAIGLRIAQGLGIGVLFAAGLVTARLAGATCSREVVYVITLPSVGLVIVALEVAAQHVALLSSAGDSPRVFRSHPIARAGDSERQSSAVRSLELGVAKA